ncbi:GNAT family protein [Deinococcus sonorensis]|uniref:GNAT family protein n=2 Tax=Deinococcus sonorensis TaxID=309891 RepID=A0AAU7UAN2_9DEIO
MGTLTLRPLQPGDEETAVIWAASREFCDAIGWTPDLAPRKVRDHWRWLISGPDPAFLRLGIVWGDQLIGYTDLAGLTPETAEYGIALGDPAQWGQGLGTWAGQLMLQHAFEGLQLDTLSAEALASNLRSQGMLRRLGFVPSGLGTPELHNSQPVPVLRYRLTRAGWLARNPPAPG